MGPVFSTWVLRLQTSRRSRTPFVMTAVQVYIVTAATCEDSCQTQKHDSMQPGNEMLVKEITCKVCGQQLFFENPDMRLATGWNMLGGELQHKVALSWITDVAVHNSK